MVSWRLVPEYSEYSEYSVLGKHACGSGAGTQTWVKVGLKG